MKSVEDIFTVIGVLTILIIGVGYIYWNIKSDKRG